MVPGAGTALNVAAILAGAGVGTALRGRLPDATRGVVTDGLGLVTLVIAAENAAAVSDPAFAAAVGRSATLLVVLGAVLIGGIVGSLLGIERRLEGVGAALQRRFAGGREGGPGGAARARFIEGFVDASLVFVIGPLAILGSLSDGLGRGIQLLALKSTLDGFASIAFAASFGWGVAAAALSVAAVQGSLTALGFLLGGLLPASEVAALTATGGLVLVGVALRLLRPRSLPVGDLLPALAVAPALSALVAALR
ncbi:MAG TPA: DUF554 domain-containing protein [Mycobacteriales bacterium]|nr:DUF554 domain-containing protein [Mycobacteriales bacterium]